jgi:cleavage and polyadenylation specificity factor subunit 6/7
MPHQTQMSLIQQENNYQHARPGCDYQQQQQGQSPLLGHQQQLQQLQQGQLKLSDIEFQEAFEKNRIVSSSAITRALQDASIGQYPSAMETLITAMSLIKQSKIAHDDRCKLFIISLEDTKKSIEDKYYGSGRSLGSGGVDGPPIMMNSGHVRSNSRDRER